MAVEDLIEESKSRLEALLAPIAGGVGEDVSYDEAFDALKNETDKLTAVAGGKVDWGAVMVGADGLLSEKSKDFRVALYYATAKAHTDGLPGLVDGFVLLRELITAYWEPMYPSLKRPKARGNLVGWFADLANAKFQGYQPTASDADLVKALDALSGGVDRELRDRLADNYPGMLGLMNLVRSLVASLPKDAPPPQASAPAGRTSVAPPPVASGQAQPVASAQPAFSAPAPASMDNPDQALDAIGDCGTTIGRAADVLRVADPGNPLAYRYGRVGAWMRVVQTPVNEAGVTILPAPPQGIRANLDSLMASEDYLGAVHAADESAQIFILWLDLQRYAASAMDRLGAIFMTAKKALLFEVAVLIARLPQLPNLKFEDGTPLADGMTKMWLEGEVQAVLGGKGASGGGNGVASALDAPIAEAGGLAAAGKLNEALDVLAKAAATATSGADRFRGRFASAKLCLQTGRFALARAQLEGLVGVTEQHRLAEWEPALCADLYAALYASHRGLNVGDEVTHEARARETAAFERLCQLDAAAALKLSAEGTS